MKTIYIVHYDWAFNGGSNEGILGCYECLDDAVAKMNEYWEHEKGMDYFDLFDASEENERLKERWTDGFWYDRHDLVEVMERYLYSREDVANGLA